MKWFLFFLVVFVIPDSLCDQVTPSEQVRKILFTKCKKVEDNKEKMVNCIKEGLQNIQEYVQSGIPEWSFPPLDPLAMDELVFEEDNGSQVRVKAHLRNLRFYGAADYEVTDLEVDYDTMNVHVGAILPRGRVTGNYELNGQVFFLPVVGNGTFWATVEDVKFSVESKMIVEDNRLIFNFQGLDFTYDKFAIRFNNLFNGDNVLGEVMNTFLNSNAAELIKEVKPLASKVIFQVANEMANSTSRNIPIEDFPGYKYLKQ